MGETENPSVWSFTTLADQTVNTFPWSEGFEGDVFPPLGWKSEKEGYTAWDRSNYKHTMVKMQLIFLLGAPTSKAFFKHRCSCFLPIKICRLVSTGEMPFRLD